jgi:hypothetical protein
LAARTARIVHGRNGRDQHLDAGHQATRLPCACAAKWPARLLPAAVQKSQLASISPREALVAIEHHHQLPEEHGLGNGGGEANQNENCANSASGLHTSRIRRKLVVKSKAHQPWISRRHRRDGAKR